MLAIGKKTDGHTAKCIPNVLPCRINHNGTVDASKRYWNPIQTSDGKTTAYFRGRKLYGKEVKLPAGYHGAVLTKSDRILPKQSAEPADEEEEPEQVPDVKVMEEESEFDSIMVWGHEAVPEDAVDPYVKGLDEWLTFSQSIHSYKPNGSTKY